MEAEKGLARGSNIEMLTETNFHVWKKKINLFLAHWAVDFVFSDKNNMASGSSESDK